MAYEKIVVPADGEKITLTDGKLNVPDNPIVAFIEGDGTGPDIWAASQPVLDAAVEKAYGGQREIVWMEVYAGDKANDVYKETVWLPQETHRRHRRVSRGDQGAADHAGWRRNSQHQRGAAPAAGPVCLRATGALFHGRSQPGEAAGAGGHGDLSREHGRHLCGRGVGGVHAGGRESRSTSW